MYQKNKLEDESDFLQLGQSDEIEFHTFQTSAPQPTAWTDFPNKKDPYAQYKYASFDIELNPDLVYWQRQTYSVLDFLGDLGGLLDALRLIGEALIAPFSEFALKVTLMATIFYKPLSSKNSARHEDFRDPHR